MNPKDILKRLKSLGNPRNVEGMVRFGISAKNTYGVSIPNIRKIAKEISKDPYYAKASEGRHSLAQKLWDSKIHEVKILAAYIDEPGLVTKEQMDAWICDFDSWDVCDQVCANLFDKTTFAFEKAKEWVKKDKEFEKRAGFALMACLAWHDKVSTDEKFTQSLPLIRTGAEDARNFVKKAVNWALRQIGKRSKNLNKEAIKWAKDIGSIDSKSASWIANDALRELESLKVKERFN